MPLLIANHRAIFGTDRARQLWKGCLKKRQYKTIFDADNAAWSLMEDVGGKMVHSYFCKYCRHWHVGHSNQNLSKGWNVQVWW